MQTKRDMVSVYPQQWVYETIGHSTPELNRALTAWATQLLVAIDGLQDKIDSREWEQLAELLHYVELDPQNPAPQEQLGEHIAREASVLRLEAQRVMAGDLAKRVKRLSPIEAHAIGALVSRRPEGWKRGKPSWWLKDWFVAQNSH